MKVISALIARAHAPVSMRGVDIAGLWIGATFVVLALYSLLRDDLVSGVVALLGGAYLLTEPRRNRRYVRRAVWEMAASDDDPVSALAVCEYLYRLPLGELAALSRWQPGDDVPPQLVEAVRVQRGTAPE